MPPAQVNPFLVLAYVLGTPTALAILVWVVKGIFFLGTAMGKLDLVDEIASDVKQLRHDRRDDEQALTLSLSFIEEDINVLQVKANVPVRRYPDRRVGPPDRRAN